MINSFLVTLHNSETQPTNPSSEVGDVLWPDTYLPKTFNTDEAIAEKILFDGEADALRHFLRAIQMLWVVENSVHANTIFQDDPRTSYTQEQLEGQFKGTVLEKQQISRILGCIDKIPATKFLSGELLETFRFALSPMDRLAAVIAHFGKRP